jgi:two-component system response regulator YesN
MARQQENNVPASRRLVDRAVKLIGARFSDPELNVGALSRELRVNEDYLSASFKKEYGIPLVKFLTRFRLEKARDLMNDGMVNLAYIAERVGYEDPNYFGKCFKKHFGVAPSKFLE